MKKNSQIISLFLLFLIINSLQLLFCQTRIKSNVNYRVPNDDYNIKPSIENGNRFLSTNLMTDSCRSLFLKLTNISNDSIDIAGFFTLESPLGHSYLIICYSDTLLREYPNEARFNFGDSLFYYNSCMFTNYVDPETNIMHYYKVVFGEKKSYACSKIIMPRQSIMVPIIYYFEGKYIFLRFQTAFYVKDKRYLIRKETKSIYMPKQKCSKS